MERSQDSLGCLKPHRESQGAVPHEMNGAVDSVRSLGLEL